MKEVSELLATLSLTDVAIELAKEKQESEVPSKEVLPEKTEIVVS
jgi:hypothetical protein